MVNIVKYIKEGYGTEQLKQIRLALEKGVEIDPNTLYPLLRRLEKQGLLKSEWDTQEAKPRKYYRRTVLGDFMYEEMKKQWSAVSETMNGLLREE